MDDKSLIEEYLNGNGDAFKELYEKYKLNLFNFIYSMIRDEETANDIFQDVFIKVIDNLRSYKDINFKAWIFKIARNTVLDYLKSAKTNAKNLYISIDDDENFRAIENIVSSDENPEKIFFSNYQKQELYKAIAMLSDDYREIIYLKHFSDLSFIEISAILNVPIGTLLSRFKRAIDKLSIILEDKSKKQSER